MAAATTIPIDTYPPKKFPVAFTPERRFMIETISSLARKVESWVQREDEVNRGKVKSERMMAVKDRTKSVVDR